MIGSDFTAIFNPELFYDMRRVNILAITIDILLIRCEFVLQRTHGGDSAVESSAAWLE